MSSDRRQPLTCRRTALLGLLALGGCGFAPVYGNGTTGLRGRTAFQTPDTVSGFRMRQRFEDRLGLTRDPQTTLTVTMHQTTGPAAISSDGDTTRLNINGIAEWTLAATDGALIGSGQVRSFTSYSSTGSTVATQTAAIDAERRLAVALADLIIARVALLGVQQ